MPTVPEFDGLKASAAAVALTLLPGLPQMREKKVGKLGRESCTVTMGLTPNAAGRPVEQSGLETALTPLPAEYITLTPATAPPIAPCVATAVAASVAGLVEPPQIACHVRGLPGSPVMPEREITRAAASAA